MGLESAPKAPHSGSLGRSPKSARFVHRVYTVAELEAVDRCVVCDRATSRKRDADFGEGASTLYMTTPLPEIRVCEGCDRAQHDAIKLGRPAVAASLALPVALVLLTAFAAPGTSPFAVAGAGLFGLLASRVVIAHVRARRAQASRLLFVDGAAEEVVLQLRLEPASSGELPYREEGRAPRTDGLVMKPVGPRVRATLAFIATTILVMFASFIGGFGSYPVVIFDNPRDVDLELQLDRDVVHVPAGGAVKRTVSWGTHRLVGGGLEVDVAIPWGKAALLTWSAAGTCYDTRRPFERSIALQAGHPSALFVLEQGDTPRRTKCPSSPQTPW